LASLERLRGQDEPFWTAVAASTAGFVEMTVGRYDDALRHLREISDLTDRFDNAWLAANSRVQLAPWRWCEAGWRRRGRCWTRRWS
jgi:hypothetical protein